MPLPTVLDMTHWQHGARGTKALAELQLAIDKMRDVVSNDCEGSINLVHAINTKKLDSQMLYITLKAW